MEHLVGRRADPARPRHRQGRRDAGSRHQARRARGRRGLGVGDGQELADALPHRPGRERAGRALPASDEGRRDRSDGRGRCRRGLGLGRARRVQPRGLAGAPRPGHGTRAAPVLDPRRRRRPPRLRRGRALGCEHPVGRAPKDRPADGPGSCSSGRSSPSCAASRPVVDMSGRRATRMALSGRSPANGNVLPTIDLHSPVTSLRPTRTERSGPQLGDEGTAIRIDPTTSETRDLRHRPLGDECRRAQGPRRRQACGQSVEDVTGELSGRCRVGGAEGNELFDSGAPTDPAFTSPTWDGPR